MALSNGRVTAFINTTSDAAYTVKVNGTTVFSGKACYPGSGVGMGIDITEILKPYVHADEITSLSAGLGPTSAAYSISSPGNSVTSASGVVNYCNDFASVSLPNSLSARDWGLDKIPGHFYFSYSAQGSWSGAQYGSYANTCQYNAQIIFTDIWGMPQAVPVRAILSTNAEWSGYARARNYQSSRHRNVPMDVEKQLSFTCYTPNLKREERRVLARWLAQSEYVYLYDIGEGQLHPCVTPAMAEGNARLDKLTITLQTDY